MKAILLAGGKGTRLRPLTLHTPKPIVPIFDRPFLHYQIDLLKQVPEIDEVILSLNYQPRRIEETFGDGAGIGMRAALRRRAVAARHRRRDPLRRPGHQRHAGGVQRRRDDRGRRGRRRRAAPRAEGQGDDRADAGRQPVGLRAGRDRRRRQRCGASSRSRSADEITCDTINAGIYVLEPDTFDRIPKDMPYSIERGYFPSLVERGETFVAYVDRGYWIDIGTPEKYVQRAPRHLRRALSARPAGIAAGAAAGRRRRARSRTARVLEGPCFVDAGAVVKAGARSAPTPCIGRGAVVEEDARVAGAHRLAERPHRPATPSSTARSRPQLPRRPQRARRRRPPCSATRRRSRTSRRSDRFAPAGEGNLLRS